MKYAIFLSNGGTKVETCLPVIHFVMLVHKTSVQTLNYLILVPIQMILSTDTAKNF